MDQNWSKSWGKDNVLFKNTDLENPATCPETQPLLSPRNDLLGL